MADMMVVGNRTGKQVPDVLHIIIRKEDLHKYQVIICNLNY